VYNKKRYIKKLLMNPESGVDAMQRSVTQGHMLEVEVMEVWAQRAQQQRAALDAIKAYLR